MDCLPDECHTHFKPHYTKVFNYNLLQQFLGNKIGALPIHVHVDVFDTPNQNFGWFISGLTLDPPPPPCLIKNWTCSM